jgi:large subunit ribosomal protein L23
LVADMPNSWDKKTYDAAQKDREVQEEPYRPGFREKPTRDRTSIAEQAKSLLKGETQWRSTPVADEWEDVGEAQEVETDVDISKDTR